MPIPDYQTLMLPVLKLGATGEIQLQEANEILSDQFKLSQEEREFLLPSGNMATIRNLVAWAITYLVKAGLLYRPRRGYFTATDRGRAVLSDPPDRIDVGFLERYPEFMEFRQNRSPNDNAAVPPHVVEPSDNPPEYSTLELKPKVV